MAQISKLVRKKLGEILVEEGLLRDEQVTEGLKRQRATGEFFGESLVQLTYCTEMDIARAIVRQFGLPYIDASKYRIPKEALESVPGELMWQNHFIVLDKIGRALVIAVSGVLPGEVFEKLERSSGSQLFLYVATLGQIREALKKHRPMNGAAAPAAKK
ncbi:MAG TPA: hypothetical protein VEN81_12425 [Planctomycetota bacterium]|jgi:hypothetical protein|nr:hypothetical protein [Planctomycetota bacterium]